MKHGKIYSVEEVLPEGSPAHFKCRCTVERIKAVHAGEATYMGDYGADYWMQHYGNLPPYYIDKKSAKELGWESKKENLHRVAPNNMIGGDRYMNFNGHLPEETGRIWYEADLNYQSGKRNGHRILYSNDGLVFVTYDHYETFYEVI